MELHIATEFSPHPFGRDDNDDEFNGTKFRELLTRKFKEARKNNERLEVILDGIYGLGGSFIDEAFGGFGEEMRKENIIVSDENLHIRGDMSAYEFYVDRIWLDIRKYNQPNGTQKVG